MPFDIPQDDLGKREIVGTDSNLSAATQQSKAIKVQPTTSSFSLSEAAKVDDFFEFASINATVKAWVQPHKVRRIKAPRILPIHLNACWQPLQQTADSKAVFQHDLIYGSSRCTSMMDKRSIRHTLVQKTFFTWLLMSNDAPPVGTLQFRFNSWAQMINFQAVLAECFEIGELGVPPNGSRSRKERCYIVVRNLKRSNPKQWSWPVPIIRRPDPPKGESIPEQRLAAMVGLILRRSQLRRFPHAYLDQARRLFLLNKDLRLAQRERIRMSVSGRFCSLLPDRPPWMQTPSEPIWPGKCNIRDGAEPLGYLGRLLSKKELIHRRKKASKADSLPAKILKLKLKRRVKKQLAKCRVDSKCTSSITS